MNVHNNLFILHLLMWYDSFSINGKTAMFGFLKKKIGNFFGSKIRTLLKRKIDATTLDELEELLYEADLGSEVIELLIEEVTRLWRLNPNVSSEELINTMQEKLIEQLELDTKKPAAMEGLKVILVVGVNGSGKTTTVAKLANHYKKGGKKVLVAAADTFRAAAIDQLQLWANRVNIEIVKGKPSSDPAAVVYDAIEAAKSRGQDVVIADTAGRLHTKTDLMGELEKIARVSGKAHAGAPHEILLVLDGTVGQNAISQAKIFHEFTPLTGLIVTKLDGTAKGGSVVGIQKKLGLPIRYIGVGEGLEDLEPFDPRSFVTSLFKESA